MSSASAPKSASYCTASADTSNVSTARPDWAWSRPPAATIASRSSTADAVASGSCCRDAASPPEGSLIEIGVAEAAGAVPAPAPTPMSATSLISPKTSCDSLPL